MFQDIQPSRLDNEFRKQEPKDSDFVVFVKGQEVLYKAIEDKILLPTVEEVRKTTDAKARMIYLLSVDGKGFFYSPDYEMICDGAKETDYQFYDKFTLRGREPREIAYGLSVCFHLGSWYENNRFCGHCGTKYQPGEDERVLICPECGQRLYPRISPAVIVAITDKNRILLSKYSAGYYKKHALIAGFCEAGETVEETVHREVMEETGLRVKNIRYFDSQPWPFTQSVLMGFYAELDGEDKIVLQDGELAEAEWVDRENIPHEDTTLSLTWTMIEYFRNHEEEF